MVRSVLALGAIVALLTPMAAVAQENSIVRSFHPEKAETPPAEATGKTGPKPVDAPKASEAATGAPKGE